jgi:hypothetical protein
MGMTSIKSTILAYGWYKMEFYTKNGYLTSYGLSCGYIEKYIKDDKQITLWKEHGVYHVRAHDFNTGLRIAWHTTYSLTEARKLYHKIKKGF